MDPLDRAAGLAECAYRWRLNAQNFRGSRKAWRLARADYLEQLAWRLIDMQP